MKANKPPLLPCNNVDFPFKPTRIIVWGDAISPGWVQVFRFNEFFDKWENEQHGIALKTHLPFLTDYFLGRQEKFNPTTAVAVARIKVQFFTRVSLKPLLHSVQNLLNVRNKMAAHTCQRLQWSTFWEASMCHEKEEVINWPLSICKQWLKILIIVAVHVFVNCVSYMCSVPQYR